MKFVSALSLAFLFPTLLFAKSSPPVGDEVLAPLSLLKKVGAPVLAENKELDLAYTRLSVKWQEKLLAANHEAGRCGGFELLPANAKASGPEALNALVKRVERDAMGTRREIKLEKNPKIESALKELKEENLRELVGWISSFPSRSNRLPEPNAHVRALEAKLREMMAAYPGMWAVEQISHQRTRQNSLRLRLTGKSRPQEIVVLGGHFDSITHSWGGGDSAPGADDNASGSANLIETLRVLITKGVPDRSLEFFWYAGEESGLLGSAEIAQEYKAANKDVVAVLQLDMTSFPGSGEFVVGNISDFTSAWLRQYLVSLNEAYVNARLVDDQCGYGCSDHASWYRQGYSTIMPFEAEASRMNRKIHTENDRIDSETSFRHSLTFAKFALALAMDMGNSTLRE